jgi:hypothetical protein
MMDARLSILFESVGLAGSAVFVTILAVYGAIIARLERHLGGLTAIGADDVVHLPGRALAAIPLISATKVVVPVGSTLARSASA